VRSHFEPPTDAVLSEQRVLITGAAGQLGRYLVPAVRAAGGTVAALGRRPAPGIAVAADLADREATLEAVRRAAPDVVIHAAACTDVDGIEREPWRGEASNVRASLHVAQAALRAGAYLIAVGTDMVFPGDGGAPYVEHAPTNPISAYGRSKLAAERAVLAASPEFAVARTAWLYGGPGKHFPRTVLTMLRDRGAMEVVEDEVGSPTFAGDLAEALVRLASLRGSGVFHLVNAGGASRFELARETAKLAGLDPGMIRPITTTVFLERYPLPARRPSDSRLANVRAAALGVTLRDWRKGLADYVPTLAAEVGAPAQTTVRGG
jgi:dTDP-4-dehydrorhamnose reductase